LNSNPLNLALTGKAVVHLPRHAPSSPFSHFWFKGDSEYLEALVARVDAPRLNYLYITFFNDIVFDTPQFTRFISDTPTFEAFNEARVALGDAIASIRLSSKTSGDGELNVEILCRELDWQVSFLEQVCTSSLSPLSTLEDLYIDEVSILGSQYGKTTSITHYGWNYCTLSPQ
jgi:hypothetical protein